jgi:hypothetical protein
MTLRRYTLLLLLLCFSASASAQMIDPAANTAEPAEIQFVFGSDTSTGGIRLDVHDILYRGNALLLYMSPTGNGARIMDPALRQRLSDWYGDPMRLTWWMQGGSVYQFGQNTNVPLASTIAAHLMDRYHGDAIRQFGDEMSFHYHTWRWVDYTGDGRFYWNQTKTFEESREDFDLTTAQFLIEEGIYAVTFRSGWHFMDNAWQQRLDELLPFSMHNDAPNRRTMTAEPIHNVYDWSRSPLDFVPFRPSAENYQLPGGSGGWNVRSRYLKSVRETLIRPIFASAADGVAQVVTLWSHLAESDFVEQVENAVAVIRLVAADYPDVPFRFTTGIDAMQRWLETDDRTPPALDLELIAAGQHTELVIRTDEPIFQRVPFVAVKDRYEAYHVVTPRQAGPQEWIGTMPYGPDLLARIRVAVTDSVGNLGIESIDLVPDDVFVDNDTSAYSELSGTWRSRTHLEVDQVWGNAYREAALSPGQQARVRWTLQVEEPAQYNVFIRAPLVEGHVEQVEASFSVNGSATEMVNVDVVPGDWTLVRSFRLTPADALTLEVRAEAGNSPAVFAADAVRLSPLIRGRQLQLTTRFPDFGDVRYGVDAALSYRLRSLGNEPVSVLDVSSAGGLIASGVPLPFALGAAAAAELPLTIRGLQPGALRDTLIIVSDDPVQPVLRLPFMVRFMDYWADFDNDDSASYEEAGVWHNSSVEAWGSTSRFSQSGTARATHSGTLDRSGYYDLSFIVPTTVNAATRAGYVVRRAGMAVDSLVINQNDGSGSWRSLGLYRVEAGERVEVEVRWADGAESGRVLRADAIRFSLLGDDFRHHIADNDAAGAYEEYGTWSTSVAQAYGPSSRFAAANAGSRAVFHMTAGATRLHSLEMIVPEAVNSSRRARYRVYRNGALADSVFVDQNHKSGSWRLLGSYLLTEGDDVKVEVSHASPDVSGQVLRADALRLGYQAPVGTSIGEDVHPLRATLTPPYPNPASALITFGYEQSQAGLVRVRLYDVLGRVVGTLVDGDLGAGRYAFSFDVSALPSGVYFARLESNGLVQVRQWVVAR